MRKIGLIILLLFLGLGAWLSEEYVMGGALLGVGALLIIWLFHSRASGRRNRRV